MREDCTVLVCSCDKYADLQGLFAALFRRYWPDCPFPLVLVTETGGALAETARPANAKGFDRVIACGPGLNWASRLVKALDAIPSPYVLMLCDDYFLESPVEPARILRRLETMKRLNAANLRLVPNPKRGQPREEGLMEYPKQTAYCVSTLAGFWERGYLRRLAEPVKSIWEFERYGSFAVADEKRPILATVVREFPFVDAVHKGHWERFGVKVCRENGLSVDFAKRGLPSPSARLREALKAVVFALVPNTWIVRVQNRFGLGEKEKVQKKV